MSRSDRRHGERRNWSSNDNSDKSRSGRSDRQERGGRRHESRGSGSYERRQERRRAMLRANSETIRENEVKIRAFKESLEKCEICGEEIADVSSAISNRGSGNPVHFDCVLNKLSDTEKIASTERLAYIGQGKFAVIYFANPHDPKKFSIRRTIEWEARDQERSDWRNEMAGLYSQVK